MNLCEFFFGCWFSVWMRVSKWISNPLQLALAHSHRWKGEMKGFSSLNGEKREKISCFCSFCVIVRMSWEKMVDFDYMLTMKREWRTTPIRRLENSLSIGFWLFNGDENDAGREEIKIKFEIKFIFMIFSGGWGLKVAARIENLRRHFVHRGILLSSLAIWTSSSSLIEKFK